MMPMNVSIEDMAPAKAVRTTPCKYSLLPSKTTIDPTITLVRTQTAERSQMHIPLTIFRL